MRTFSLNNIYSNTNPCSKPITQTSSLQISDLNLNEVQFIPVKQKYRNYPEENSDGHASMSYTKEGRDFSERDLNFKDESSTTIDGTQDAAIVIQNTAVFSGFVDVKSPFNQYEEIGHKEERKETNNGVEFSKIKEKTKSRKIRKSKIPQKSQALKNSRPFVPASFERDCVSAFFHFPHENKRDYWSSCSSIEPIEDSPDKQVKQSGSIHESIETMRDLVFRKTSSLKLLVVQNPRYVVEAFEKHLSKIFNCDARLSLKRKHSKRSDIDSLSELHRSTMAYFMELKNPYEYLIYPCGVQNAAPRNQLCPGCGDKSQEPSGAPKCNCKQQGATCVCITSKAKPAKDDKPAKEDKPPKDEKPPKEDKPAKEEKKCSCMKDGKKCECYKALQGDNAEKAPPEPKKDGGCACGESQSQKKNEEGQTDPIESSKRKRKKSADGKEKPLKKKRSRSKSRSKKKKSKSKEKKECSNACILPSQVGDQPRKPSGLLKSKPEENETKPKRSCMCTKKSEADQVSQQSKGKGDENGTQQKPSCACGTGAKPEESPISQKQSCQCGSKSQPAEDTSLKKPSCQNAPKQPSENVSTKSGCACGAKSQPTEDTSLKKPSSIKQPSENISAKSGCQCGTKSLPSENASLKKPSCQSATKQPSENVSAKSGCQCGTKSQASENVSLKKPSCQSATKEPSVNVSAKSGCQCGATPQPSEKEPSINVSAKSGCQCGATPQPSEKEPSVNVSAKSGCQCGATPQPSEKEPSVNVSAKSGCQCGATPQPSEKEPSVNVSTKSGCQCSTKSEASEKVSLAKSSCACGTESVDTQKTCDPLCVLPEPPAETKKRCPCGDAPETDASKGGNACKWKQDTKPCICGPEEPPPAEEPPPLEEKDDCACEPPTSEGEEQPESLATFKSEDLKKLIGIMKNAKEEVFKETTPDVSTIKCIRNSSEIICRSQIVCPNTGDNAGQSKVNTIEIRIKYPKCPKDAKPKRASACTNTSKQEKEMSPEECAGFESFVKELQKQVPLCCTQPAKSDFSMLLDSLVGDKSCACQTKSLPEPPRPSSTHVECIYKNQVTSSVPDYIEECTDVDVKCLYRREKCPSYHSSEKVSMEGLPPAYDSWPFLEEQKATQSCQKMSCTKFKEPVGAATSVSMHHCSIPCSPSDVPWGPCQNPSCSNVMPSKTDDKSKAKQKGKPKVNVAKKGSSKIAPGKKGSSKIAAGKKGSGKIAPAQKGSSKIAPAKKGSSKVAPAKKGSSKIEKKGSSKISATKKSSSKLSTKKGSSTKSTAAKPPKKKCFHGGEVTYSFELDNLDQNVLSHALDLYFDTKQDWKCDDD